MLGDPTWVSSLATGSPSTDIFSYPLYRDLRELAMSYFHEYANRRNHKTLREYSLPYDLRRVDPKIWVSGEKHAWFVSEELDRLRAFMDECVFPAEAEYAHYREVRRGVDDHSVPPVVEQLKAEIIAGRIKVPSTR